jgi:hypothetical protein
VRDKKKGSAAELIVNCKTLTTANLGSSLLYVSFVLHTNLFCVKYAKITPETEEKRSKIDIDKSFRLETNKTNNM